MLEEIDKEVAAAGRLQADRVGWGTERESEHAAAAMLMLFQIFLGLQLHPPPARPPPTILLLLSSLLSIFLCHHSNPIHVTSLAGGLSIRIPQSGKLASLFNDRIQFKSEIYFSRRQIILSRHSHRESFFKKLFLGSEHFANNSSLCLAERQAFRGQCQW